MKKDSAAIVCPSFRTAKFGLFLKRLQKFCDFYSNRQTWAGCETERGQRTTPIQAGSPSDAPPTCPPSLGNAPFSSSSAPGPGARGGNQAAAAAAAIIFSSRTAEDLEVTKRSRGWRTRVALLSFRMFLGRF
jgi:hypothetical protein